MFCDNRVWNSECIVDNIPQVLIELAYHYLKKYSITTPFIQNI